MSSTAWQVTTAPGKRIRPEEPSNRFLSSTQAIEAVKSAAKVVSIEESPSYTSDPIAIDDLYPDHAATSILLGNALTLLNSAIEALSKSAAALGRGEQIDSDEQAIRCQSALPELFCCRALGDGFGAVVNAAIFAFRNNEGTPFSKRQIEGYRLHSVGSGKHRSLSLMKPSKSSRTSRTWVS